MAQFFTGDQSGPLAEGSYNPNANQAANPYSGGGYGSAATGLLGGLQSQVQGGGPNPAGSMLAGAQDTNAKQSLALAGSARGNTNPGLALYGAQQELGQSNQQAANAAATQRAQQQLAAQGLLGNLSMQGLAGQAAGNQFNAAQQNSLQLQQNAQIAAQNQAQQAWYNTLAQAAISGAGSGAGSAATGAGLGGSGGVLSALGAAFA